MRRRVQVGRAGRDGAEAQCHTFINDTDYLRLRSLTFSDGVDVPELQRLVALIFPPDARAGTCACVVVHTAELELGIRQEVRHAHVMCPHCQLGQRGLTCCAAPGC